MRKIAKILLFLASLGLSLIGAEVLVRLLPEFPVSAMGTVMRRDPEIDHSLRPHSTGRMVSPEYDARYTINSVGQRDDEPVERAIMILGDSFMEGYGVNRGELVADRLEQKGLRVVNAGVKSYSPLLEYLYLKKRGLALRPDTVILFFDLSDPSNDDYYARRLVRDESGLPESIRPRRLAFPEPQSGLFAWLDRHSALYNYLSHLAYKYFPASNEDAGYSGCASAYDLLFPGRDAIPDTAYYPRWDTALANVKLIRNLLRDSGVDFILVSYPYGHEVDTDAWREGRKGHQFPSGISSDRPFRFLERWAAAESIPIISLDRAFKEYPDPELLYFTWDGHWTSLGHELAAEEVYLRLVPESRRSDKRRGIM